MFRASPIMSRVTSRRQSWGSAARTRGERRQRIVRACLHTPERRGAAHAAPTRGSGSDCASSCARAASSTFSQPAEIPPAWAPTPADRRSRQPMLPPPEPSVGSEPHSCAASAAHSVSAISMAWPSSTPGALAVPAETPSPVADETLLAISVPTCAGPTPPAVDPPVPSSRRLTRGSGRIGHRLMRVAPNVLFSSLRRAASDAARTDVGLGRPLEGQVRRGAG
eukprot:scaffold19205_cov87-Isochrysis_galbana.AAC.2